MASAAAGGASAGERTFMEEGSMSECLSSQGEQPMFLRARALDSDIANAAVAVAVADT